MNSSIRTWLYRFLDSRGLAHATGKPLYTYRITLAEYDELRSLLKHAFKLPDPFGETPTLEAACLLFSAARLSLAYAEGAWQWKTVDEELPRELTFDEHKRIVKTGAVWWRLHHSIQDDGKRFIGFVMIQAGISLNALENDAGLIAKGIQETLRLIRKYPELSEATLREYVRSQVPRPDSFAEHLFVDLLCTTSRALYRAFKSLPERPTEADFVKAYGTVKDDFPACFFEVKHLERLYQARLRVEQSSSPLFNIRRFVRWNPDDPSIPRLVATARLPKTVSHVSAEELAFYFHNFSGPKPNQLASILVNGRLMARLRRTNAEPIGFSVRTNERIRIEGNEAAKGLFSLMRWMDGHTDEIVLGNLGPLDPDEPVAFARTTVEDEWVSVGSGSVKTAADRVLLACRADALLTATEMPANMPDTQDKDVSPSTQLRLLAFDWLEVGGKKLAIYEVRTNCRVKIDGDEYNIVLRAACGIEQSYWLQGQFFGMTDEGWPMYKGEPSVFSNGITLHPLWRLPNGRLLPSGNLPADSAIPLQAIVMENNRIVKRIRCVVVPNDAKIVRRIRQGTIVLENWGDMTAVADNPAVSVAQRPDGVELVCERLSNQDAIKPFSVSIGPRVGSRYGVQPFRMTFGYPQEILAFVKDGDRLKREDTVTLDEIRNVKAYAVTAEGTNGHGIYLEMQPAGGAAYADKRCRLELPLSINPFTSSGTLTYDEYRAGLFRLMRLSGEAAAVYLRLRSPHGTMTITVANESEGLHYDDLLDSLFCRIEAPRTLRFVPFTGSVYSSAQEKFVDVALERRAWVILHEKLPLRTVPWIAYDPNDPKHRLKPVVLPPSDPKRPAEPDYETPEGQLAWKNVMHRRAEDERRWLRSGRTEKYEPNESSVSSGSFDPVSPLEAPATDRAAAEYTPFVYTALADDIRRFEYLRIPSIWQMRTLTKDDFRAAEHITRAILADPTRPEWDEFLRHWRILNRRGVARMPYWDALQQNVPLALELAVVLEFLFPKEAEDRSLLYSLGRYKTWRWDFLSIPVLTRVLETAAGFWAKAGLSREAISDCLDRLLELDSAAAYPVLGAKLRKVLVLQFNKRTFPLTPDDPFFLLARESSNPAENFAATLHKRSNQARLRLRGTQVLENMGPANMHESLGALLKKNDPAAFGFAKNCGLFDGKLSESAVNDDYLRAVVLADFAWARGYAIADKNPALLRELAGRKIFFGIETIYDLDEVWTAWATSFASAMDMVYEALARSEAAEKLETV